jgi:hypothetical protein
MQGAMAALASGQAPELLQHMASTLRLPPAQLQRTAAMLHSAAAGGAVSLQDFPPELLQRAAAMQQAAPTAGGGAPGGGMDTTMMAPPGAEAAAPPPAHAAGSGGLLLGDEEGQHWLSLYRGAYLKRADLLLGPVFTSASALLFWAGLLPFWAALPLLPLLLVATVRVVLVQGEPRPPASAASRWLCSQPRTEPSAAAHPLPPCPPAPSPPAGAGIPPRLLPTSRLPAGVVASWEAATMAVFVHVMLPALRDLWAQCGALLALASAAYYLHFLAATSDPGALPAQPAPRRLPPEELAAAQAAHPHLCFTCNIYRPIRSKHCQFCGVCRPEFCHHCPIVANCVAAGNRRAFAGYLVTLLAAELLWCRLALLFFRR